MRESQSSRVNGSYEDFYKRGTELLRPIIFSHNTPLSSSASQLDEGIELLEAALRIEPTSWPALWLLGMAFTRKGNPSAAFHAFSQAYQLNPDDKNVCRELGLGLLRLGYSQLALLLFDKLTSRYPGDHGLIANLALCHWMLGNSTQGLKLVENALGLNNNESSMELRRRILETLERGIPAPSYLEG